MAEKAKGREFAYALLALTLAAFFWSTTFVIGRGLSGSSDPFMNATSRWLVAGFLLLPWLFKPSSDCLKLLKKNWLKILLLGFLGATGFNLLLFWSLEYTSATSAIIFLTPVPLIVAALQPSLRGLKTRPLELFAAVVSLIGVVYILFDGDLSGLAALSVNKGDLLILVCCLWFALYSIYIADFEGKIRPLFLLAFMVWGTMPFMLLAVAASYWLGDWQHSFDSNFYRASLFLGVFPSVLSYLFYNYGVQKSSPFLGGLSIYLQPVFGFALIAVFLNESFSPAHRIGGLLVLAGILISLWLAKPGSAKKQPG